MILVFGSINIDLVFTLAALPRLGKTVLTLGYVAVPGGKGANQAAAAVRDGASVRMVGRVRRDGFGQLALRSLDKAGVDIAGVAIHEILTGCAVIAVDQAGENQIMVASGANTRLSADQVEDCRLGPETTLVL